ncbi:MAG: oligosaccharide flippase family protein [Patescibacteria group bacterium UBA2163]
MVYLASGGFWLTVGQGVSSLSAFALAIAFANLVPPETYGTYKYLLSIAAIFAIFTLPGMNTAVARAVARGNEVTVRAATKARLLWSFLGTLAAFGGALYYFINGNMELAIALAIIGAVLPLFDTFTTYNGYLTGKREFKKQSLFHLVSQSISTASLIGALLLTNNVLFLLLAYFVPLAVVRFVLYKKVAASLKLGAPDKETLTYGKHLSFINVLGVVAGSIDKILLWKFLGPAQLAIYVFALAIPEQMKGPLKGIGELAFPKFAAQTPEQIHKNMPSLWRKLALYATGLFGISLLYILAAPFIFKFLFPQYMESVIYSQIFSLTLVTAFGAVLAQLLAAQKKIQVQYIISTVQPIIAVALFLIFIPIYEVWGAILAFAISRLVAIILYISAVIRNV